MAHFWKIAKIQHADSRYGSTSAGEEIQERPPRQDVGEQPGAPAGQIHPHFREHAQEALSPRLRNRGVLPLPIDRHSARSQVLRK